MANEDFTIKENTNTNYKAVGRSGTFITSDTIQNDYLPQMNGIEGQELYARMLLSDSQIRKLYHAVGNPIKSANFDVEPHSDSPEHIKQAALIKHIIFEDIEGGFKDKLDEILTFPWHGHSVFEVIHKNRINKEFGTYTGLDALAFRDQRTLDRWKHNTTTGKLETIHQLQSGDIDVNVDLDVKNLIIFYNEKKGSDNGYAFCRMLFGNYKRKLLYKQLQAIGIERAALPVPHLKLPEGIDYDSDEYKDAVEQLAAFTQGEQAFFVTPAEYDLTYNQTGTYDPAKVQVAIKAENEEIVGSLVAMWLEMGIGGNSAVGSSTGISADFFRDGIEYLADKIVNTINQCLIPNLMALNFGDIDGLPKLTHSGIADEAGLELMQVVTGYTNAGVITPDEPLEDHIRKSHNLPKKVEGEILDNKGLQDDTTNDDTDNNAVDTTDDIDNEEPTVEVELSSKSKDTPKSLIEAKAKKVSLAISEGMKFSSAKYINDVMVKYRQLPEAKKQNANNKVNMGGSNNLKKDLKRLFTETVNDALTQVRKEIPGKANIELNTYEADLLRLSEKYGDDIRDIKLNDFSKLPPHIQLLIAKQAGLIAADSLGELQKRIDFALSGIILKSNDSAIVQQAMTETANEYIEAAAIATKGVNVTSTLVNESRSSYYFEPEVLDEIHSFTFVNIAPKSAVCRELAGTTFRTTDASSLRYNPPLHHNCKSYLRANLKSSKGIDTLNVTALAPSAEAIKSITL